MSYLLAWLRQFPEPHQVIQDQYLDRWWLVPRNRWFNIYLHRFRGGDTGRHPHDHPWNFLTIVLKGSYLEQVFSEPGLVTDNGDWFEWGTITHKVRTAGNVIFRRKYHIHSIPKVGLVVNEPRKVAGEPGPCWTLVFTGRKTNKWGFWVNGRHIYWRDYVEMNNEA